MRTDRNILLAGIAAVAVAGSAGLALAKDPAFHTMTVQLPDGGFAQIQYTGNVPPKVTFGAEPYVAEFYGPASPFAALVERISAEMDREMNALMREADATPMPLWNPDQMFEADLHNVLPGTTGYSVVSTVSSNGNVCTRTTGITSAGNGQRPKVVSHTSGNCNVAGSAMFGDLPFVTPRNSGGQITQADAGPGERHAAPRIQDAVYRSVR